MAGKREKELTTTSETEEGKESTQERQQQTSPGSTEDSMVEQESTEKFNLEKSDISKAREI